MAKRSARPLYPPGDLLLVARDDRRDDQRDEPADHLTFRSGSLRRSGAPRAWSFTASPRRDRPSRGAPGRARRPPLPSQRAASQKAGRASNNSSGRTANDCPPDSRARAVKKEPRKPAGRHPSPRLGGRQKFRRRQDAACFTLLLIAVYAMALREETGSLDTRNSPIGIRLRRCSESVTRISPIAIGFTGHWRRPRRTGRRNFPATARHCRGKKIKGA